MFKRVLVFLVLLLALAPATLAAQPADDGPYDTLIRVNGLVHVRAGETAQGVVVIGDDAIIDGNADFLLVIDGNATITGVVEESVIMVNGAVTLMDGARVGKDVLLYRADAVREAGATVAGNVRNEWGGINIGQGFLFWLWASMTVAFVAGGLLFAAFGGRQLAGAAEAATMHPGGTLLTALALWVGVPVITVFLMATVIGIPLGLGVLVFLLPALWFAGYLVAGATLGRIVFRGRETANPYLAVTVGLVIFQVIAIIPFAGGTVAFFAGLVGAGALVYRAWAARRGVTPAHHLGAPMGPATPLA